MLNSYNKLHNKDSNKGINQVPWKHCDREGLEGPVWYYTITNTLLQLAGLSHDHKSCFVPSHFSHSTNPVWYSLGTPHAI